MIQEKALVLYKNRPAIVSGAEDGKFVIYLLDIGEKSAQKVRDKDVELLHPGPCNKADLSGAGPAGDARSAWELLTGTGEELALKELSELIYEEYSPKTALEAWKLLEDNHYFIGDIHHIKARSVTDLEAEEKKRNAKEQETKDRDEFLARLRKIISSKGEIALPESDRRFLQDVEALAHGHSDKSRTLKELGKHETPVDAHRLLLACGAWTMWENPYPSRFGLYSGSAKIIPPPPLEEDRVDLTALPAFAIDSPWSNDPDDAISLEISPEGGGNEGRFILWVHVADPASSVTPNSPADLEAQNRGATLYLPEGSLRMLAPETLPYFALGVQETSPALSFKMILNPDLSIAETQVIPSRIRVTRLTYEEADTLATEAKTEAGKILSRLLVLAEKNIERRLDTGAVMIELPDAHISVQLKGHDNKVSIEPVPLSRSTDLVRECMLLAGEGAARWAVRNKLPFPFISQEAGELPKTRLPGLAGAFQLRKSMRPRTLSVKPGVHWGLGLDMYTQVTSPLRRYTDLLAHQQIRSFLKGNPVLSEEEITLRMAKSEAGTAMTVKAERASKLHWTAVYLADRVGSAWEGVILDNQGNRAMVIIPELGMETQVPLKNGEPNEKINLSCLSVKIPEGEILFTES
ncbi:MAG: RNB domain-containing ribonuclease [Treponema sp.]|jgi:exoribonuclease-2|nr:RNB domain-containing ribonuclease [Treponema sp.]